MEQIRKKTRKQCGRECAESLKDNQSGNTAGWRTRVAESLSKLVGRRWVRMAIVAAVGVLFAIMAIHFLSSPERWIRL